MGKHTSGKKQPKARLITICTMYSKRGRHKTGQTQNGATQHFMAQSDIIIVQALIANINAQTKHDHAVNAACRTCGLIKVGPKSEHGSVEEPPDQILDGLSAAAFSFNSVMMECFGSISMVNWHAV